MMQVIKNKKVWFFFVLGVMILTTVCLWQVESGEKKVYANGRIVQQEDQGAAVRLPFVSCSADTGAEVGAGA